MDSPTVFARPGIIWLASYPKSGNTWLRAIVYWLLHGQSPSNSRSLDAFANSKAPPQDFEGFLFKKTHCKLSRIYEMALNSAAAIYIHRHPLDVLCSALNYEILTGGLNPERAMSDTRVRNDFIDTYIAHAGHPKWQTEALGYGSWMENTNEWTKPPFAFPVLHLSYGALIDDTENQIGRIADFLGVDGSAGRLRQCSQATSFEKLREMEADELDRAKSAGRSQGRFSGKERQKAVEYGVRFFNVGKNNTYTSALSAPQIEKAWSVFRETAGLLGYSL